MKVLKKLFASEYAKEALLFLNSGTYIFNNPSYEIIKNIVENYILSNSREFNAYIRESASIQEWALNAIRNVSANYLGSGELHIYRGVLNELGPGENILKLFDDSTDELVKIGYLNAETAIEQKDAIRETIKGMG